MVVTGQVGKDSSRTGHNVYVTGSEKRNQGLEKSVHRILQKRITGKITLASMHDHILTLKYHTYFSNPARWKISQGNENNVNIITEMPSVL